MLRKFTYTIEPEYDGCTVEAYLKRREYSRHILVHLKKIPQGITVNNAWARTKDILRTGDLLQITLLETESSPNIVPVSMPLSIIYEDKDLLVIDKPADTPVHPSMGNYKNSLANGLAWYFSAQNIPFVFRCINRLDRDTTGLLIIAKNMLSANILSRSMKSREIKRTYLAVVKGKTPSAQQIEAPIARKENSVIERCVDFENGEYACTRYKRLAFHNDCSLLSLNLETGRTHQIRVHMKHIGHPLLGDFIYYPDTEHISRQALHSHQLTFRHPVTKEALDFTSPLPSDMKSLIE